MLTVWVSAFECEITHYIVDGFGKKKFPVSSTPSAHGIRQ